MSSTDFEQHPQNHLFDASHIFEHVCKPTEKPERLLDTQVKLKKMNENGNNDEAKGLK